MDRITEDFIVQIQAIFLGKQRRSRAAPGNLVDWMVVLGMEQRVGFNRIAPAAVLGLE